MNHSPTNATNSQSLVDPIQDGHTDSIGHYSTAGPSSMHNHSLPKDEHIEDDYGGPLASQFYEDDFSPAIFQQEGTVLPSQMTALNFLSTQERLHINNLSAIYIL